VEMNRCEDAKKTLQEEVESSSSQTQLCNIITECRLGLQNTDSVKFCVTVSGKLI